VKVRKKEERRKEERKACRRKGWKKLKKEKRKKINNGGQNKKKYEHPIERINTLKEKDTNIITTVQLYDNYLPTSKCDDSVTTGQGKHINPAYLTRTVLVRLSIGSSQCLLNKIYMQFTKQPQSLWLRN
jgi:hypothetical protein